MLLIVAGGLTYANSFSGTWFFDDFHNIVDQPAIRSLRPLSGHLSVDRPVLRLSCVASYALSGLNTRSWHAFNLMVHLLAALALYGVVRRTLLLPGVRASFSGSPVAVALAVALLWMLHPLQTESVTYIIQRSESMMGLCFLLSLYCLIRADASRHRGAWYAALIVSCIVGIGAKPVMAMAPLVLLIYDAVFLSGSWTAALRRRVGLYGAMAACGLLLFVGDVARAVILSRSTELGRSWGDFFATDHWRYLRTQFEVLAHYLRLCLWPWGNPFCLDYAWPEAPSFRSVAGPATLVLSLFALTLIGIVRRAWWGFVGAWFFLILAPSSSLLPIEHRAFEHRMYLSLAALAVLVVLGGRWTIQCLAGLFHGSRRLSEAGAVVLVAALCIGLGAATIRRNRDYHSSVAMWTDVVAKRPAHMTARSNLARGLIREARYSEAMEVCRIGLKLAPKNAYLLFQMGTALQSTDRLSEAIACYEQSIRAMPNFAFAHANLSDALAATGKCDTALAHARRAAELEPQNSAIQNALGRALLAKGDNEQARAAFARAIDLDPAFIVARNNLGVVCRNLGRLDEAIGHYRAILADAPAQVDARYNLALALHSKGDEAGAEAMLREVLHSPSAPLDARLQLAAILGAGGRGDEALEMYREAVRLAPKSADALSGLAAACYQLGKRQEALANFEAAARLAPDDPGVLRQYGLVLYESGRIAEARARFESALRLHPNDAISHHLLACALLSEDQPAAAAKHWREALRLDPSMADAAFNLGLALERIGRAAEAREQYRRALTLQPDHAEARRKLTLASSSPD